MYWLIYIGTHRGGKTVYTEEVPIYIPINQLHRGGKTVYTEEVPIYTNQSITQRRWDSVYLVYTGYKTHMKNVWAIEIKTVYIYIIDRLVYIGTSSVYCLTSSV
jgi:hypothetical protein